MPSLIDLRLLVLVGSTTNEQAQADLDLFIQRTTAHILHIAHAPTAITLLRIIKRLVMQQDDIVVLYAAPPLIGLIGAVAGRLWKRPVLAIQTTSPSGVATLAMHAANLSLVPSVGIAGGVKRRLCSHRRGIGESGRSREDSLLNSVARLAGRSRAVARRRPLRLDIGCGSQVRSGFIGIDARRTQATAIVADARAIPVGSRLADEVYASCLLEHFDDPHEVLREIHRVLRPDGQAVLRLPNLGTYSSHLDTTHRFLADLALWRRILTGYYAEVLVVPVGTKYRDDRWLVRINWLLVNVLKWYELAQGWDFICRKPRTEPSIEYTGWWEE